MRPIKYFKINVYVNYEKIKLFSTPQKQCHRNLLFNDNVLFLLNT